MNIQELRDKSQPELLSQLEGLLKTQLELRLQKNSGEFKTPHLLAKVRKEIAQVKTILGEKAA